ncbi:FkbM family methyltransferase [Gammaproteobacteria bacterium]|nr:FkbM family methyltransferase [Gammaproteobacteria bacterium]
MNIKNVTKLLTNPLEILSKIYVKGYTFLFGLDPVLKRLIKNGILKFDEASKNYYRDVKGHKFNLNLEDGGISRALAIDGIREKQSVDALYKFMNPNMNVLDLGSNIGFYLLLEAQIITQGNGSGKIVGCEPFLSSVELSKKNITDNGYDDLVKVFHAAISDKTGPVKMASSDYSNCHQLLSLAGKPDDAFYEVPGFTVQDFLEEAGMPIQDLDFLRMDTEGGEYLILPTILDELEKKDSFLMFIEFHPHVDTEAHINLLEQLDKQGFVCRDASKEFLGKDSRGKEVVLRKHMPEATISDLYKDPFYTQMGGIEVFLSKGIE